MDADGVIRIKDVYEIVERLEDKIDQRLSDFTRSSEAMRETIDRIDRQGSIGTKQTLLDHEERMRGNEARLTTLEDLRIKREEVHAIRGDIAAIRLSVADRPAEVQRIARLEYEMEKVSHTRYRLLGAYTLLVFLIPVIAAIILHFWG